MMQHDPLSNCRHNVSQLIREIHKIKPDASNQEIKDVLLERYGVEAGSHLVIQTIGSESKRLPLMQKRAEILPLAEKFLQACDGNRLVAQNLLIHAVK